MVYRPEAEQYLRLPHDNPRIRNLGILTMRKAWLRGSATRATIRSTELGKHFDPSDVTYAGNDAKKAEKLTRAAYGVGEYRQAKVALYDDRPNKVGQHVLELLVKDSSKFSVGIIAAEAEDVNHPSMSRLADFALQQHSNEIAIISSGTKLIFETENGNSLHVVAGVSDSAVSTVDKLMSAM